MSPAAKVPWICGYCTGTESCKGFPGSWWCLRTASGAKSLVCSRACLDRVAARGDVFTDRVGLAREAQGQSSTWWDWYPATREASAVGGAL